MEPHHSKPTPTRLATHTMTGPTSPSTLFNNISTRRGSRFSRLDHPPPPPPPTDTKPTAYRFLTAHEWVTLAHGLGAVRDIEGHDPVHPTCWYWPPKLMPDGLYKDVVQMRTLYFYQYHSLSSARWGLMLSQLFIGAALTALASYAADGTGTALVVLAALNTVNAGLLALLHNSGLPDRYRSDQAEFHQVEDYIKALLDSGLVAEGMGVCEVLADCFDRYQQAKATVNANIPATYTSRPMQQLGGRSGVARDDGSGGKGGDPDTVPRLPEDDRPETTGHSSMNFSNSVASGLAKLSEQVIAKK